MMLWYKPQTLELRSWEPGLDEEGWEVVDDLFVPALPLENLKTMKKEELVQAAASAYTEGFWSKATGETLFYDSEVEDQHILESLYNRVQEKDWKTTERYKGICPAGQAPIRARKEIKGVKAVYFHTKEQLIKLGKDLESHIIAVKLKHWRLQERLQVAENAQEIEQITWNEKD